VIQVMLIRGRVIHAFLLSNLFKNHASTLPTILNGGYKPLRTFSARLLLLFSSVWHIPNQDAKYHRFVSLEDDITPAKEF
jgi:hypothetical protein